MAFGKMLGAALKAPVKAVAKKVPGMSAMPGLGAGQAQPKMGLGPSPGGMAGMAQAAGGMMGNMQRSPTMSPQAQMQPNEGAAYGGISGQMNPSGPANGPALAENAPLNKMPSFAGDERQMAEAPSMYKQIQPGAVAQDDTSGMGPVPSSAMAQVSPQPMGLGPSPQVMNRMPVKQAMMRRR